MNKYEPYSAQDIYLLMNEPWEISDRPYMLHAAYALSCIFELVEPETDDDEDEAFDKNNMWGSKVPKELFNKIVQDTSRAFNDAADNHKKIDVWGRYYTVRKTNSYDHTRLGDIFNFKSEDDEYIIEKEGVMNLSGITSKMLTSYQTTQEEFQKNKNYLRQVIMMAEDDDNDGWDKLTDMEIVMYCWARFYNKTQSYNQMEFLNKYKDYIFVDNKDIKECWIEKAILQENPIGMYTFSAQKVQSWNNANGQESKVLLIQQEDADNYWYDVALQKTFKPLN